MLRACFLLKSETSSYQYFIWNWQGQETTLADLKDFLLLQKAYQFFMLPAKAPFVKGSVEWLGLCMWMPQTVSYSAEVQV